MSFGINSADLSVLVIDDHMIIRQVLEQNLRGMGFSKIDTASNYAEARDRMSQKKYDIFFVDWILPGAKSGYVLLQECRQERDFDDTAFVMVTTETDERHMIEALKAGATSYIMKPVTPNAFNEKVTKVLDWLGKKRSTPGQAKA
jgi:two-component system chemotaxis response regulator CheY